MIKMCLEEFGSGSRLNRHQVSEAEAARRGAGRSPGLKPVGMSSGVVGWVKAALTRKVRRRRDFSTQRCPGVRQEPAATLRPAAQPR